jgi:hypothetical protein
MVGVPSTTDTSPSKMKRRRRRPKMRRMGMRLLTGTISASSPPCYLTRTTIQQIYPRLPLWLSFRLPLWLTCSLLPWRKRPPFHCRRGALRRLCLTRLHTTTISNTHLPSHSPNRLRRSWTTPTVRSSRWSIALDEFAVDNSHIFEEYFISHLNQVLQNENRIHSSQCAGISSLNSCSIHIRNYVDQSTLPGRTSRCLVRSNLI